MSLKCHVIVNPTSGGYSAEKLEAVMGKLERHGLAPVPMLTGDALDATRFARIICRKEEAPLIVAGGGDGTVNGVLNGLVAGKATLGLLPFGTANVLARELRISGTDEAVERIVAARTRPLAVGVIEGQVEPRVFFLMAGIGLDGAVVKDVRLAEKKALGKGAYLLAALRQALAWDPQIMTVKYEGGQQQCHSAIVCNGARYGGNFILAPEADIFTAGFEVVCIRNSSRSGYAKLALALASGRMPIGGDVVVIRTDRVEIAGKKSIQVDGDYLGDGQVSITAVPDFVRLIV